MTTLDQIRELLPKLSAQELKDLKADVVYQQKYRSTLTPSTSNDPLELIYQGMKDEFERRGLPIPHWGAFRSSDNYTHLKTSYTTCQDFFDNKLPRKRVEKRQAIAQTTKLLLNWLADWGMPLTIGIVCRNMRHAPVVVDRAFPGYIESGLLSFVFNSRKD